MKKITKLSFILILLSIISCNKEEPKFPENLKLNTTINSGCLNKKSSFKSTYDGGYFEYSIIGKTIEIVHKNLQEHCAADMSFEMVINSDNKIILKEVDNADGVANCQCYYNISTTIENIVLGLSYQIEIWNENMTVLLYSTTIYT